MLTLKQSFLWWFNPIWLCQKYLTLYGDGKGGGDAPDFGPLAAATEKAAELSKQLGDEQLAENKRQYDQNYAVAAPVIQAQAGLTNQQIGQGNDYYNYMQQFSRPTEMSLFYEAMGFTPEEVDQINASRQSAIDEGDAKAKAGYEADMARYNADVEAAKTQAYFVDSSGKTVQADQISKVLPPQTIPTQAPPQQTSGLMSGISSLYSPLSRFNKAVQLTDAQKEAQTMQQKGYYQVITKDGQTLWVQSGAPNTNPSAREIFKPAEKRAEYDFTDANNLTVKLGMTAAERMKAQDQAERDAITAKGDELATRLGETNTQVYNRYKDDIEAEAGQAVADSRSGYTNALNVAARQGIRYGMSPAKLAAAAGVSAVLQGGQQAAAANGVRKAATETMYGRGVNAAQEGVTVANQGRAMKLQDESLATAKKLDTAGLYRGLPGASQGAYSTAINAGNSAVGNQMQPSTAYMNGINAGNATIMRGTEQQIQGLSNIAQMQTAISNSSSGSDSSIWGALGQVGGAAIAKWSDKRVKKNVKPVSEVAALKGITKLNVKSWQYDPEKIEGQDDREHIGAMAQDMQKNLGDKVSDGHMVDMISALGVNMAAVKALSKKVDELEKEKA